MNGLLPLLIPGSTLDLASEWKNRTPGAVAQFLLGDSAFRRARPQVMMYASVQRILALPDATRVFVCHDYKAPGRETYAWESTVGDQKRRNVHIGADRSMEDFIALRQARDASLGMPRLIIPSLQVNMRAGHMPPPENDGNTYLKLPINGL